MYQIPLVSHLAILDKPQLKGLQAERAKLDDEIAQIKAQLNQVTTMARSFAGVSSTAAPVLHFLHMETLNAVIWV